MFVIKEEALYYYVPYIADCIFLFYLMHMSNDDEDFLRLHFIFIAVRNSHCSYISS